MNFSHKKLLLIMLLPCFFMQNVFAGNSDLLKSALKQAGSNKAELKKALKKAPKSQKDGLIFLIENMPQRDLESLKAEYLLENLDYAYKAREEFTWASELPEEVFFNDVLPYATFNERRDNWRKDFYETFSPMVKDAKDITEAIQIVNKNIKETVGVIYSTKRPKADQSPYESMDCGLASCTGLSVLLADAFRAVGIPSRIVGTPSWTTKQGNHNWNEVYVDGKWHFVEYYPTSGFDQGWFLADAGQANPNDKENWIYASSFKKTDVHFPLVWDRDIEYVSAINVTQRYIDLYEEALAKKNSEDVVVRVLLFKEEGSEQSDDRVVQEVFVMLGCDEVASGKTSGAYDDMNNILEFKLKKNTSYQIVYDDHKGKTLIKDFKTGSDAMQLKLYTHP